MLLSIRAAMGTNLAVLTDSLNNWCLENRSVLLTNVDEGSDDTETISGNSTAPICGVVFAASVSGAMPLQLAAHIAEILLNQASTTSSRVESGRSPLDRQRSPDNLRIKTEIV